jgi:nicotinate-nucleotide pyrophosphorylase (carboxylating)
MEPLLLRESIKSFLFEDIGSGDITSSALFDAGQMAQAVFVAKEHLIAAGLETVAAQVFAVANPQIICRALATDGQRVAPGDILLEIAGPVLDLLKAERVALNLTQRLSGIAGLTAKYIELVADLPVKIVDTRKTTPGLRALEKYAVRVGGGHNHRFSLSDGILIKDNHIEAAGSIKQAVDKMRHAPHTLRIEVEAETISQLEECLACGVDAVLLDNMSCETMREAVKIAAGKIILEASGGVNLHNVREIAATGVDIISIGALTHSATACDISMAFLESSHSCR